MADLFFCDYCLRPQKQISAIGRFSGENKRIRAIFCDTCYNILSELRTSWPVENIKNMDAMILKNIDLNEEKWVNEQKKQREHELKRSK